MSIGRLEILAIAVSVAVFTLVIQLIRRRRLRMEYSIVWLFGAGILFVFSLWRGLLDILAGFVGIYYAPAVLLLVSIFFATVGFLHFSVAMSRQAEFNKRLTQEVAFLRHRIEKIGDNSSE